MKLILGMILMCALSMQAFGVEELTHGFTAEQSAWMANKNLEASFQFSAAKRNMPKTEELMPYGEYADQGYLIFNDEFTFNSYTAKRGFLENLPASITPVVFTQNESPEYIQSLRARFGGYMLKGQDKLKIMYLADKGNSFWARDNIPVPVYSKPVGKIDKGTFTVIDALYYYDFEPDEQVGEYFNAEVRSHKYFYEGGNFVANAIGDCLVVNNERVAKMPDSIFESAYGCKRFFRLPYLRGIGHADESVKFVGDNLVLTDLPEYQKILEAAGFQVIMMPRAKGNYETYLNSVILEDTIYVPVFGNELDEEALAVYRNLGYHPVPLDSYTLSNKGLGSLHCISMVYPKVRFTDLLKNLGGEEI